MLFNIKNFDLLKTVWFKMAETETGFMQGLIAMQLNKKNPAIK